MGLDHIGLTVRDLDEAVVDLKEKGARFYMEPHVIRGTLRIAFLRGPDNVSIELMGVAR